LISGTPVVSKAPPQRAWAVGEEAAEIFDIDLGL
jgi:hypothetical protein